MSILLAINGLGLCPAAPDEIWTAEQLDAEILKNRAKLGEYPGLARFFIGDGVLVRELDVVGLRAVRPGSRKVYWAPDYKMADWEVAAVKAAISQALTSEIREPVLLPDLETFAQFAPGPHNKRIRGADLLSVRALKDAWARTDPEVQRDLREHYIPEIDRWLTLYD